MDQIMEQAKDIVEGQIDFQGQRLAEYLMYGLLTTIGAIAFLVGYTTADIHQTLYVGFGGTILTFLVVTPQWPFFNQHFYPWLPAKNKRDAFMGIDIQVDGKSVGQ